MKIPLYKLFLIQAAYAIPLAAFCRLGPEGIVSGLIVGTGLSGLILLIRRDNIRSALKVGVGSIVGVYFGGSCVFMLINSEMSYNALALERQAWRELGGAAIGAVIAGLCVSSFLNRRPVTTFHLHGEPDDIVSRLFHTDGDYLYFGFRGCSQTPASLDQVWGDGVDIRDYIMERFVTYRVRADRNVAGVRLEVQKLGTQRDQYVDSSVRHYIQCVFNAADGGPPR
jgi:hypothetical protein